MKKFLLSLCIALLGIVGSIPLNADGQAVELTNISIVLTDKDCLSKDRVIEDLLALQKSLLIPIQVPIPEENVRNGFLLIPMTPFYVNYLLEEKQGIIVGAYQENDLVGYILLIDIGEFKELYQDPALGFIETDISCDALEKMFSQPNVGYIEQIGVKRGLSKRGIGAQLIEASKKLKINGLVADVFLEPLTNQASLQFFSKVGFEKAGVLHQNPRKNFPYAHRTQVFFWNLQP